MERGVARDELDVLLGRPQLERDALASGKRPDHVEQQPSRQDHDSLAADVSLERDPQADVHVRGA